MKYCFRGEAASIGWWNRLPEDVRMMLAKDMDKRPNQLPRMDADEMELNEKAKDALISRRARQPVEDDVIRVGDTFVCDKRYTGYTGRGSSGQGSFVVMMEGHLGKELVCETVRDDLIEAVGWKWLRSQCRKVRREELEPLASEGWEKVNCKGVLNTKQKWYHEVLHGVWLYEDNHWECAGSDTKFATWLELKKTLVKP